MEPQTIKISLQSIEIPAINIYVHVISILLISFFSKLVFGKQILNFLNLGLEKIKDHFSKVSLDDWIAHCRERKDWPQKQDVLNLDLKGCYLKSLVFSISLTGHPRYWRAGFIIGNEKLKVDEIADTRNGITIHTGSAYEKKNKILPVWKYYANFDRGNPDFSSVKSDDLEKRSFSIEINRENFMKVKVQNELIFAQKIDSSFRRKTYLKAWVDNEPDAKIKFKNIMYSLWS